MKKVENFRVNNDTKKGDCCPECGANWDGGDIYEHFLEAKFNPNHEQHAYYKDKSLEKIRETASSYGWTEETPKRFGKIIGVELVYDDPRHYDGVSFWKCPNCEIAWNRFTGNRTDEFVTKKATMTEAVVAAMNKTKEELGIPAEYSKSLPEQPMKDEDEDDDRQCVYRSLTTPDGTVLVSHHNHDYVTHVDKNGETYMLDGGPSKYYRTSVNTVRGKITEVYLDEGHEKIRDFVHRGGRGKNSDQPLTWVPVSKMNDNWIEATITYNEERGMGHGWFNKVLKDEISYRQNNHIVIPEEENVN